MGITRRAALCGLLTAGATAVGVKPRGGGPADAAGRRRRAAVRHDALHRLQGLRGRVPGRERPAARSVGLGARTTRRSI